MRLLTCELRKILSQKSVWIILFAFFALNTYLYLNEGVKNSSRIDAELIAQYSSSSPEVALSAAKERFRVCEVLLEINEYREAFPDDNFSKYAFLSFFSGDIKNVEALWNEYNDSKIEVNKIENELSQLTQIILDLKYINSYPEIIQNMNSNIEAMLKSSIFNDNNGFSYRNIIKTGQDFSNVNISKLKYSFNAGVVEISKFVYSDIFILVLIFLFCYYLFIWENELGIKSFIKTTENGRNIIFSKLIALVILTVSICLLYEGVNYLIEMLLGGFGDLSRSIQSISNFRDCALPLSVGEFLAIIFIIKVIASIACSMVIGLLFQISRSSPTAYFLFFALFISQFLLYSLIHPASVINVFKYFNLFAFFDVYRLFNTYVNVNLFALPVSRHIFYAVGCLAIIFTITVLNIIHYRSNWNGVKLLKTIDILRNHRSYFPTSLLYYESFKNLKTSKRIIIVILALSVSYSLIDNSPLLIDRESSSYLSYVKKYQGKLTKDKIVQIEKEIQTINDLPHKTQELMVQYTLSKITKEEFDASLYKIKYTFEKSQGLSRFINQYNFLQSKKDISNLGVISEVSTDALFFSREDDWIRSIWVVMLTILMLSGVFTFDYNRGIDRILGATYYGALKLLHTKMRMSLLLSMILFLILRGSWFITMITKYNFKDFGISIQSIEKLSGFPWHISIAEFIAVIFFVELTAVFLITQAVLLISQLFRKETHVIMICTVIFILPLFLSGNESSSWIHFFSINKAFHFSTSVTDNYFLNKFILYFTILFLLLIVIIFLNICAYKRKK